jgi:hypothetical protein
MLMGMPALPAAHSLHQPACSPRPSVPLRRSAPPVPGAAHVGRVSVPRARLTLVTAMTAMTAMMNSSTLVTVVTVLWKFLIVVTVVTVLWKFLILVTVVTVLWKLLVLVTVPLPHATLPRLHCSRCPIRTLGAISYLMFAFTKPLAFAQPCVGPFACPERSCRGQNGRRATNQMAYFYSEFS